MTVPNLQDGFMVFNYDGDNLWQTGIECVLVRNAGRAYLAQECRAEAVNENPLGSKIGNYEVVGISTWKGNYLIYSGSKVVIKKIDSKTFVSCTDKEVQWLTFDEVLNFLQQDWYNKRYRKLYMKLTFGSYKLYAPCRYINFPKLGSSRGYLQPISGYVLYEKDNHFFIAYVVTHIAEGVTKAIQFIVREVTDFTKIYKVKDKMQCSFFSYE